MKKKILFVVHQLNHGGVQKSLIAALNALDYEENEVTLYIRKNRVQLLDAVNKNVLKIIINKDKTHYYRKPYVICLSIIKGLTSIFGKKAHENFCQKKIVTYINESQMKYEKAHYFDDDIEYDVAVSYIQGYTAQFVAEYIQAKKKIMFFHGSVDENHELHERIMPEFHAIVGVNGKIQEILEKLYPINAHKMTYLENYVDALSIREKSKEYVITRKDKDFILCSCGRLAPVKGYDLAIEAAKHLKEKGVSFYWYFVGDGPERTNLENLIKKNNLTDCVEITGMKDNPYPYIVACDVYLQPSYEEAHPLTIIEAMILDRPVVTTATVGGVALVKNGINGLYTNISAIDLANGIVKMISNQYMEIKENIRKVNYSSSLVSYKESWKLLLK